MQLNQYYGIAGAPLIEQIVEYFKDFWGVSGRFAPLIAIIFSLIWNLILGYWIFHSSLQDAISAGLLTSITASTWHEITK